MFFALNGSKSTWLDSIMWLYSQGFIWLPMIIALCFLLIRRKRWRQWVPALSSMLLVCLLGMIVSAFVFKPLFTRFRPVMHPDFMDDVKTVYGYVSSGLYGFISGHSAAAFGFAAFSALLFKNRFYTIVICLWALIMAYSRIYLGVHFITDVIPGMLSGLLLGWLVYLFYKWWNRRLGNDIEPYIQDHTGRTFVWVMTVYLSLFPLFSPWVVSLMIHP